MKIIICVKQIRHTYTRTGTNPAHHFLAREDSVYRVNPHDEASLELALRIKDSQDNTEIFLLALGPVIAEDELRRCLAMGADHLYRIDLNDSLDPWKKSLVLAHVIKDLGYDLVLCGKESLDTQNGQMGAFLAHHLNLPFVSAITDINISQDNTLGTVHRRCGRGMREEIQCRLPAVFTVDMGNVELRLPTYEAKKTAQSYIIQLLNYDDNGIRPKVIPERIYPPRPRSKRVPAPDSRLVAYQRIQLLLAGSRVEKRGEVLTGSPQVQVEGILSFLQEHGFIKSKQSENEG